MTAIESFSVDQLRDAVYLAHFLCKACKGQALLGQQHFPVETPVYCLTCKNKGPKPGFVWALPGMQERCPGQANSEPFQGKVLECAGPKCLLCHGTGYVAKRDLEALLFHPPVDVMLEVEACDDGSGECRAYVATDGEFINMPIVVQFDGYAGEQALLRAVAQALVASGATLGATR